MFCCWRKPTMLPASSSIGGYTVLKKLGEGAYAKVYEVEKTDHNDAKRYALKTMPLERDHRERGVTALRELLHLRHIRHPNVIAAHDMFWTRDRVCFVWDKMDATLAAIIRSPQSLTLEHIQFFMYQIFNGLAFLHGTGVIHRDIKPDNIFINRNCDVRIGDLGMARLMPDRSMPTPDGSMLITVHVVTRHYRAPEVLVGCEYGTAIDMWSAGCIMAELALREVAFPGVSSYDQVFLILQVLGVPTEEDIESLSQHESQAALRNFVRGHQAKAVAEAKQKGKEQTCPFFR